MSTFRPLSPASRDTILRIVAVYIIAALAWIIVSDLLPSDVSHDRRAGMVLGLAKGVAFVARTSVGLGCVLARHFPRRGDTEADR